MPDRAVPTPSASGGAGPAAPAAPTAREVRSSMPVWVALVLLVACVLAANLAASVFRSPADGVERAPARPDASVDRPVRDAG
jgi:hypothetical protein